MAVIQVTATQASAPESLTEAHGTEGPQEASNGTEAPHEVTHGTEGPTLASNGTEGPHEASNVTDSPPQASAVTEADHPTTGEEWNMFTQHVIHIMNEHTL